MMYDVHAVDAGALFIFSQTRSYCFSFKDSDSDKINTTEYLQSEFMFVLAVFSNSIMRRRIDAIEISKTSQEMIPGDFILVSRAQNCISRVLCIDFDVENSLFFLTLY